VLAVVTINDGRLASVHVVAAETGGTTAESACTQSQKDANSFNNPSRCATKEPNPILPEMREIVWGGGSFIVLFLLLRLWLYPSVKKSMDLRAAKVSGDLASADQARASVESERQSYAARLAAARAEAAQVMEAARAEVEAVRSERVGALNAELAAQRATANEQVEAAKAQAQASLADTVAQLATQAASKVLGRPLDPAANRAIVDEYLRAGATGGNAEVSR
jgi:F-type H+-transporting ATPase subunit b